MLRKQFIGLSFASLLALLSEKVFGDTMDKPLNMATLIKHIQICDVPHHAGYTESYYFDLSPYWVNWFALVNGSLPVGITAITNPLNGCVLGFTVDELLVSGNTTISINGYKDTGELIDIFTIEFNKGVCVQEIELCCEEGETIRWLSISGGIMQWVFSGVREFEGRVGDANTFKNINNVLQYSQRKDIYLGKRVTSGDITQEQYFFLNTAKTAIQAWEITDPILIDNDSFKLFKSTDKFFDASLQYILATEQNTQTQ